MRLNLWPLALVAPLLLGCGAKTGTHASQPSQLVQASSAVPATVTPEPPAPEPVDPATVETRSAVSECHGFGHHDPFGPRLASAAVNLPLPWDVQQLHWSYADGTLRLTNTNVRLNCCGGILEAALHHDGDRWVMHESESPKPGPDGFPGGLCGCICPFDFVVEASGLSAAPFDLLVTREIDSGEHGDAARNPGLSVFEGTLDLSQGEGSILVSSAETCEGELDCLRDDSCESYAPASAEACAGDSSVLEAHCDDHIMREVFNMDATGYTKVWDRHTGKLIGMRERYLGSCGESEEPWGSDVITITRGEIPWMTNCVAQTNPCAKRLASLDRD